MTSVIAFSRVNEAHERKREIEWAEAYLGILKEIEPLLARLKESSEAPKVISTRLDARRSRKVAMDHWYIRNAPTVMVKSPFWRRLATSEDVLYRNFWLREDGIIVVNVNLPDGFKKRQTTQRYDLTKLGHSGMRWLAEAMQKQGVAH